MHLVRIDSSPLLLRQGRHLHRRQRLAMCGQTSVHTRQVLITYDDIKGTQRPVRDGFTKETNTHTVMGLFVPSVFIPNT